jgi:hypothetical protein
MSSFKKICSLSAVIAKLSVLIIFLVVQVRPVHGQEYQFFPDEEVKTFYAHLNPAYAVLSTDANLTVAQGKWDDMLLNPSTWTTKYDFINVVDVIKVGINHNIGNVVANFKYKITLQVKGYKAGYASNPSSGQTETRTYDFVLEYNADSLQLYKDVQAVKLENAQFHKMEVSIVNIFDISNPNLPIPPTVSYQAASKNFFIQSSIITNRYDKQPLNLFITSIPDVNNHELNVKWAYYGSSGTPDCNTIPSQTIAFKPVKYELEWTYVDDYKINNFNNAIGSYGYNNTATNFSVPYDFKNNATRIQTYDGNFKIPIIYEHGAIVFRIRTIRPSPTNYGQIEYSAWNLPETLTLTPSNFNSSNAPYPNPYKCSKQCLFIITEAFEQDKFDWQYSINFAEEGKYKHVLNYFDGAGRNRQTQTKLNTDNDVIIAADKIYDYEGRAAIQTLPIPVPSQNLKYKNNLSLKAGALSPYKAADFDKGCFTSTIPAFDASSLAGNYYSPSNPNQSGMQKFVPDAEGYPFIQTIFSPDNTDKVLYQGGAGQKFQISEEHVTSNAYVRAGQMELNTLFGTQAGKAEYYPKVITKDPNKQLSYSIFNQSGKVVATALVGNSPDNVTTPIDPLDNLPAATTTAPVDILANLSQSTGDGMRSANYAFFPDADGSNSLFYSGTIPPYPTNCNGQYINAEGIYDIKVVEECGTVKHSEGPQVVGVNSITTSNASQPITTTQGGSFTLNPEKYTLIKELYFPESNLKQLANQFTNDNSGYGKCYEYEDVFIRRSIEVAKIPCRPADTNTSHCDLLKRKMMDELYPGAKYGQYVKNPNGTFAGGAPNSIFTSVKADGSIAVPNGGANDGCFYVKTCVNENYDNSNNNTPGGGGSGSNNNLEQGPNPGGGLLLYSTTDTIPWAAPTPVPSQTPYPNGSWTCQNSMVYCPDNTSKFRYQWNCTILPNVTYTVWNPGTNQGLMYDGPANNVPPDILIAKFNDAIAEKLLPYHPEYCKLLLCDDHYEEYLKKITTYSVAQGLNLSSLAQIIAADPIYDQNTPSGLTYTALSKFNIGSAANQSNNPTFLQTLDKIALESAYCGCDNPEAFTYCKKVEYANQIQNLLIAADTQLQDTYIRKLIGMYITNRTLLRQRLMDGTGPVCEPCGDKRMTLTGDPVFKPVFNSNGTIDASLGLPADVKAAFDQAMAGNSPGIPSSINDILNTSKIQDCEAQVNAIYTALKPYFGSNGQASNTFFNALSAAAACSTTGVGLTPETVKTILLNTDALNDFWNPYLATYGIFDPKKHSPKSNFVSKSPSFYNGLKNFVNQSKIKDALRQANASGSVVTTNITLNTTTEFEATLGAVLAGTTGISAKAFTRAVSDGVTLPPFGGQGSSRNYIALVLYLGANRDTLYFAKRFMDPAQQPAACNYSYTYPVTLVGGNPSEFGFQDIHSLLDDPLTGSMSDGIIADNLVYAQLSGYVDYFTSTNHHEPSCDNYVIWSHSISMMNRKDPEALDDCLNCVQIREAVTNYYADAPAWGLPVFANHPSFKVALTNYLNYKLKKDHDYDAYERLMQGCALSDFLPFKKSVGQFHLSLSETDANNLITNINSTLGSVSINYFSYKAGSNVELWLDLNSVPAEKQYKVKSYLSTTYYPAVPTSDFDANSFIEVLLPTGCSAPSWTFLSSTAATVSSPVTVYLKKIDGTYTEQYTKYSITGAAALGSSATAEKAIADVIDLVKLNVNNTCAAATFLDARSVMRSKDYYTNADRQAYLAYAYGLMGQSLSTVDISNKLAPGILKSAIPTGIVPFSGLNLVSYRDPWCSNVKENLYYSQDPVSPADANWTKLNTIINNVKTALGGSRLFPVNNITTAATTGLSGAGSDLKVVKMANGWAWYRLFDDHNKLFNVYLIPSDKTIGDQSSYTMIANSVTPVPGKDSIYRFSVKLSKLVGGNTHTVTCFGYTDFGLKASKTISNVVLADEEMKKGCLDTLPCERLTTLTAIMQGKAMYAAYMDSIKQYHFLAMREHFPVNTVDRLDFTTQKRQYQYTLYNYDLAGNLTSTVPPQGVTLMTNNLSQVDIARNGTTPGLNTDPNFYPAHTKKSEYWYNSFNQLIKQETPDAGITTFIYDKTGRLVFSQNAKQKLTSRYSYTLYDEQGRINETGVIIVVQPPSNPMPIMTIVTMAPSMDMSYLAPAVRVKAREDVVATFYDEPLLDLPASDPSLSPQENLRKRVSSILYIPKLAVNNSAESFYSYGTHFSYDALGNVKTLTQDNPYLHYLGQRFKRMDYDYDLLSGKVNMVSYNRGKADQFYQRYTYDADNRIEVVKTSNDGLIWDRDAAYEYYKHGPLAQMDLGELGVQSVQYAYTIQGWLKAINGDVLNPTKDMGLNGSDALYPRDVVAHALDYHQGDYKPIGTQQVMSAANATNLPKSLYNGNIARQTTGIATMDNLQRTYTYDQLNRIKSTEYDKVDNLNQAVIDMATAYSNAYSYDADGNIKTLIRRDGSGTVIDNLDYKYTDPTTKYKNTLGYVNDIANNIEGLPGGQTTGNYEYDAIGNLVKDVQGNIQKIDWNVYGKVTNMEMNNTNKLLHYDYDAMGNRVRKDYIVMAAPNSGERNSDVYVRDASGNIMAVYKGLSKITGGLTITWINETINDQHGSWTTPSGTGISPFLFQQFGNNGQFTTALMQQAMATNPQWCVDQVNQFGVNQFLLQSGGLFNTAVSEVLPNDYSDFLTTVNVPETETPVLYEILGHDPNVTNKNFVPILSDLLTFNPDTYDRELMRQRIHQLLYRMRDELPDVFNELPGIDQFNENYDEDKYAPSLIDVGPQLREALLTTFVQKIIDRNDNIYGFLGNILMNNPTQSTPGFIPMEFVNTSFLYKHSASLDALRNGIIQDNYPSRDLAANYFAQKVTDRNPNWLGVHLTPSDQMGVLLQAKGHNLLNSYLDQFGIGPVNNALNGITGLTIGGYVDAVWQGVLLGTLNPTYTPPDVSTPDPSNIAEDRLSLAEHHIYGSSRLGIKTYDQDAYRVVYKRLSAGQPGTIEDNSLGVQVPWYSLTYGDWIKKDKASAYTGTTFNLSLAEPQRGTRIMGAKRYEMTDHLGNVLAVVMDRKSGYGNTSGLYNGFNANLANVNDYYPGGMEMPGRIKTFSNYRFGNQKQEGDDEIYGDGDISAFKYRFEDTRLNRFFSVDPLSKSYPWNSTYAFSENRLTDGVELEGLEYAPLIPTDESSERNFVDYYNAAESGLRDIVNVIPATWNGIVSSYYSLKKGTYLADLSAEAQAMGSSLKRNFKELKDHPAEVMTSPSTLRIAVSFVAGSKVPKLTVATANTVTRVVTKTAKYMSGEFMIGPRTLSKVTKHLQQFGAKAENSVMLDRMQKIVNKQMKATEIDKNFAKHELREMELMKKGMKYREAHDAVLKEQGMYHRGYEEKLYTKEALKAGDDALRNEQNGTH